MKVGKTPKFGVSGMGIDAEMFVRIRHEVRPRADTAGAKPLGGIEPVHRILMLDDHIVGQLGQKRREHVHGVGDVPLGLPQR